MKQSFTKTFRRNISSFSKRNLFFTVILSIILILLASNIFLGFLGKTNLCKDNQQECSIWDSFLFLKNMNVPIDNKDKFIEDLINKVITDSSKDFDIYPEFNKFKTELNNFLAGNELKTKITNSVKQNLTISDIEKKNNYNEFEKAFITEFIRSYIISEVKMYLINKKDTTIEQATAFLNKIMPKDININEYIRFFDKLQLAYNSTLNPFTINSISKNFIDSGSGNTLYDTLQINLDITTTDENLRKLLYAVQKSGEILDTQPENQLVFPFLAVDQLKITYPSTDQKPVLINVELQLKAYLQSINEDLVALQTKVIKLKSDIDSISKGKTLNNQNQETFKSLTSIITGLDTEYQKYLSEENNREAYNSLQNIESNYKQIFNLYQNQ